jgi:signal transduction histidine kinase
MRRQVAEAEALRELGRLRSEMLNVVSHELRTPLSLVHGFAELLQTGTFSSEQARAMAQEIYWGSTSMTRILDDLLEYNRLERGYLRLNPEVADLAQVARAAVQAFAHTPGSERITSEIPAALPAVLDATRVGQIVANLVANALKYAPELPIRVRLWEAPAGQAVLEVRDAGPGMPPEVLGRVWEMFYRGPDAQDSAVRGAGIGLPLVKRLAEAHGGTVEAESAPGRGTTFRVRLPVSSATILAVASYTPSAASQVTIVAPVS